VQHGGTSSICSLHAQNCGHKTARKNGTDAQNNCTNLQVQPLNSIVLLCKLGIANLYGHNISVRCRHTTSALLSNVRGKCCTTGDTPAL
jgi:hypothetical protein